MKNARPGVALNEYLLLAALMVVVAIPVLWMLGMTIEDNLASTTFELPSGRKSGKWARVDRPTSSDGGGSSNPTAPATPAPPLAFLDRETRTVTFPDISGTGTQTISIANGTQGLANGLQVLSKTWSDTNGNALPTKVQQTLTKLANQASLLSALQGTKDSDLEKVMASARFAGTFKALMHQLRVLEANPGNLSKEDISSLISDVRLKAGLISTVNYDMYLRKVSKPSMQKIRKDLRADLKDEGLSDFDVTLHGMQVLQVGAPIGLKTAEKKS